jgi:HD-GYP domain-containing protein (c-di-GMP phosphodiesterase class II)
VGVFQFIGRQPQVVRPRLGQSVMLTEAQQELSEAHFDGYVPIALETVCLASVLDFDLYIQLATSTKPVLYRERNHPLESMDLQRLGERGTQTLYIRSDAHSAYQRHLFDCVVNNSGATPVQRYQALTTAARSAFGVAFRSITSQHMVQFANEFGKHMAELIAGGELLLSDLLSLVTHDFHTYTHSVTVCTCAVTLANLLWDDTNVELQSIATAALMHDIGKQGIPPFVLNKPGRLSDAERGLVEQHPRMGFEKLCMRQDVTWGALMTIYQHHERIDGRGYPARVTGNEIHEWARICAVVDVYDALRSEQRPYRKAVPVRDALEYLESHAGRRFDKEIVRCWNLAIRCAQKSRN